MREKLSYAQRQRFLLILFLAALVLTIVVAAATATTLAPLSFAELAQEATAVARLRCIGAASSISGGEIWTLTQFEVVRSEKGSLPERVTIRMPGGRAGGLRSHVDGVPGFRPGEEVYLFLWNRAGEPYRVLGWTQGTFRIFRDALSGAEMITQDSSISVFDPETKTFRREGIARMDLEHFETKLRKAIAAAQ